MNTKTRILATILITLFCISPLNSQEKTEKKKADFPESDIFLFELANSTDGFAVKNGKNVTAKKGYENQPYFTPDSKSFLFAQADEYQTDVYEYFMATGETKQITDSANMEFSPQPSPDNKTISFVTDGEGANQSIWQIDRDNKTPKWTLGHLEEREPVGYYSWSHTTGNILFWSRYGFNVRLAHQSKTLTHYVSGDAVPSSPQMIPGTSHFSFLHRQGNGSVWIKELNTETKAIRPLVAVAGNNTHYGWMPDRSIVMMEGTKLHRWSAESTAESDGDKISKWVEVADLGTSGIKSATRVNVSPDGKWLAVVGVSMGLEAKK